MATMLDVAKRANVALSAVSYALNGTRSISDETRQRIFTVMEELGYQPHALTRGLASNRSTIVALLFPAPERGLSSTELEFVTSAAGFKRVIAEAGLSGVTWLWRDLPSAGYAAFNALLAEHPDVTAFVVMNERAIPALSGAIDLTFDVRRDGPTISVERQGADKPWQVLLVNVIKVASIEGGSVEHSPSGALVTAAQSVDRLSITLNDPA